MTSRSRTFAGLLVGVPVMLLVLFTLGGLTEQRNTGIPTVPFITLLTLPVDLWIRDLATALTLGALTIGLLLAPKPSARLAALASLAAIVWWVAVAAQSVLTVSEVLARPLSQSLDVTVLRSLLTQTDLGYVILAQLAMVAAIAAIAWRVRRRAAGALLLGIAMVAAWLPGLTGHSGLEHGHVAATIGLGLHMVFAGLWVGGLVAAAVYAGFGEPEASLLIRRFSVLALISVTVVAETGLLNASLRLDGLASLITSQYGAILLAKVTALIILIGWGWRHRQVIAGKWSQREGASLTDPVFRSMWLVWIGWELMWMGAVYGLSIALSRTAPPGIAAVGDSVSAGAFVVLGLGVPMAVAFVRPALLRTPTWLRSYPEVAGVLLVVVVFAVGSGSAAVASALGLQLGALLVVALLVVGGWLFIGVVQAVSSTSAIVIVMVGWPLAILWGERGILGGMSSGTIWTILLAEGLLVWLVFESRRSVGSSTRSTTDDRQVEEVGA